jgi:hypothetical protein
MFQTFVLLDELLLVLQVDIVVDIFVNIHFVVRHTCPDIGLTKVLCETNHLHIQMKNRMGIVVETFYLDNFVTRLSFSIYS